MAVSAIPAGYHSITPYIVVRGAAEAINFYTRAFNATEVMRLDGPGGTVAHAEIKIGDSHVMLGDEAPDWGALSPQTVGGTSTTLMIYVEDVDAIFAAAIAAGATVKRPVQDQFYGDRSGQIVDPFGHNWSIATHIEDLTPAEINERMAQWMATQG